MGSLELESVYTQLDRYLWLPHSNINCSQMWWCMPAIPATQEVSWEDCSLWPIWGKTCDSIWKIKAKGLGVWFKW
jgi:hypothetical protein